MTTPVSLPPLARHALAITTATQSWRAVWALLIVAVGYLALTPQPPASIDLGWDKLNHLTAFAAMASAGCFSFPGSTRQRVAALFGLLAYGGLIEILQLYIPGRTGEWADLFADSLGITLGASVAWLIIGRLAAMPEFRQAIAGPVPPRAG